MSNTTLAPRQTFLKVCSTSFIKSLVKEAKRVKYVVNADAGYWYEVLDPDHNNTLVFKAVQVKPNVWATTFAKDYWQEPSL
jgi:elongation factor P hydroxylase